MAECLQIWNSCQDLKNAVLVVLELQNKNLTQTENNLCQVLLCLGSNSI